MDDCLWAGVPVGTDLENLPQAQGQGTHKTLHYSLTGLVHTSGYLVKSW